MIFEHQSKNKKILLIASLVVLAIGFLTFTYLPVIFQEGNPWSEIKGVAQLTFGGSDMVKLSGSDNRYLTKSNGGPMAVEVFMNDRGYEYTDQMGSGYFYKSSDKTVVLTRRQYSRFYTIWTVSDSTAETNNDLWKIVTNNEGITFKYPKELLTKYISVVDWPPQVKIENKKFVCNPSGNEIQQGGQTELRLVDNRSYCVTKTSEGAAGSVYTTYTYTFSKGNQTGVINFSLRLVQCKNYDDPQMSECENERSAFDTDGTIDRVAQSMKDQSDQLSMAEGLKECLPKSDTASHEKCNELLKQITDYNSCVNAGFSIMKSNPPQCATPDGRTFVETR
ncbi:MAG: hypothetical protein WC415_00020 [Patescibacteria group bacterium]|jgi:hypothetical protein